MVLRKITLDKSVTFIPKNGKLRRDNMPKTIKNKSFSR